MDMKIQCSIFHIDYAKGMTIQFTNLFINI